MAGDWIKARVDLHSDPAVIGIATQLDLDEDTVVGKLIRLWSWADQQTENGNASCVSEKWIDRFIGVQHFADAMAEVGWLVINDTGISFPDFEKHNGQSGKRRALTAKRVALYQAKKTNARLTQEALAREEERREDSSVSKDTLVPNKSGRECNSKGFARLMELWNGIEGVVHCREATKKRLTTFGVRFKDETWKNSVKEALRRVAASDFCQGGGEQGWKADIDWFLKSDSVTKLLEGKYDNRENGKPDLPLLPKIKYLDLTPEEKAAEEAARKAQDANR